MSKKANIKEIRACRACLATDTKLYNLHEHHLAQAFTDLTAIPVLLSDGLPQQICNVCSALLLKYAAFRTQSHNVHAMMEAAHMNHTFTTTYIQNVDKMCLTLPLCWTKILTIDIQPNNTQNKSTKSEKSVQTTEYFDNQAMVPQSAMEIDDSTDYNYDETSDKHDNRDVGKHCSNEIQDLIDSNIKINKDKTFNFVATGKITKEAEQSNINNFPNYTDALKINGNGIHTLDFVKREMHENSETEHRKRIKKGINDINVSNNKIDGKDKKKNTRAKNKKTKINDVEDIEECNKAAEAINCKYIVYSIKEQIERVLARKESPNYKNARLHCEECFKGFIRERALNNHMVRHNVSSGSHICEVCRFRFPIKYSLNSHMGRHRQAYICNECGQSFESRNDAVRHHKFHSGLMQQCKECGKSFGKMTTYLSHVRILHAGKGTVCDLCGASFIGERGLKMHMKKSHRKVLESRCEPCGVQFQSAAALARHTDAPCQPVHRECVVPKTQELRQKTLSQNTCFNLRSICVACGDNFESGDRLNEHFQEVHKNQKKEFECKECNKTYKNDISLMTHWRSKHRSNLICEVCGKHFTSAAFLRTHQRIHTGEKPYKCSECVKSFRTNKSLKVHMRTHTGVAPYKCPHCPKTFKVQSSKVVHIRTHTKEKPYTCPICHKGFQEGGALKKHVNAIHIHMGLPRRRRDRHQEKKKSNANVNIKFCATDKT